jgi:hypothetical protein
MNTATDGKMVPMNFGTPITDDYQSVTTGVQISTDSHQHLRVVPISGDAWVKIANASQTAASGEGMLISGAITIRLPKAWYIMSDAAINVVPYGNG